VTDGKCLGLVEGQGECPDLYPEVPALKAAPNGTTRALVPAATFKEAFGLVPKKVSHKRVLGHLAVVLAENQTTLGATDLDKAWTVMTGNAEGRFPDFEAVLQDVAKKPAKAAVALDGVLLRELLAVAEKFEGDGKPTVVLSVQGEDDPVTVEARNPAQKFTGVLCPVHRPGE
jgi:hypothetical protein